jgi:integrase
VWGEVTPTTIAKAYRLLGRILNVAVEAGYLPRNPCTVKGAGIERAAEVAGKIIVSPSKTDAGRRVVTLPRVAVEALAAHLEEYAEPDPDGLVFTTPKGAHLLRSPFNRFVWRPAVEQVGLDGLRVHDLRHTAATLAAAAGATTKELMERMGHTSPAVALRYQHVMVDRQAALALALDDLARLAIAPAEGTQRARKGTQRARRRR